MIRSIVPFPCGKRYSSVPFELVQDQYAMCELGELGPHGYLLNPLMNDMRDTLAVWKDSAILSGNMLHYNYVDFQNDDVYKPSQFLRRISYTELTGYMLDPRFTASPWFTVQLSKCRHRFRIPAFPGELVVQNMPSQITYDGCFVYSPIVEGSDGHWIALAPVEMPIRELTSRQYCVLVLAYLLQNGLMNTAAWRMMGSAKAGPFFTCAVRKYNGVRSWHSYYIPSEDGHFCIDDFIESTELKYGYENGCTFYTNDTVIDGWNPRNVWNILLEDS